MSPHANVKTEILAFIDRKDLAALKKYLEKWLPADLAPIIADMPLGELAAIFRSGSRDLVATTFTYMPHDAQKRLLKVLNQEQAAA